VYKLVPGNHEYVISLECDIRKINGNIPDFKYDTCVTINLYGSEKTVDVKWLSLIAHFEVPSEEIIFRTTFVKCNPMITKADSGHFMRFTNPLLVNKKYRIVPNYPDYAISKKGEIIVTDTGEKVQLSESKREYPSVLIYSPDKSRKMNVMVHRLTALAWVDNSDFVSKPLVNHKDGNKSNFHASNLEWCDYSYNLEHALNSGLMGKGYIVLDTLTNEITEYKSYRDFCSKVKIDGDRVFRPSNYKLKSRLINERYAVKKVNDLTPWSYFKNEPAKGKYTVTVSFKDGTREIFHSNLDLIKRFGIWNTSYNVNEIIKKISEKNEDVQISLVTNFETKEVQALCLSTKEVIEASSIRELSLLTNLAFSTIQKSLNANDVYVTKGYLFRFKTDKPWPETPKVHRNSAISLLGTHIKTGKKTYFKSSKEAILKTGISHVTIMSKIDTGKPTGGWVFRSQTLLMAPMSEMA